LLKILYAVSMEKCDREEILRKKYESIKPVLNERARRLWAATEAEAFGRGGQLALVRATGLARATIQKGLKELEEGIVENETKERIRKSGGGRKRITESNPKLKSALEQLVAPTTRGDPESPLRWTSKSVRQLAAELKQQGHQVSYHKVAHLLAEIGYSLQANKKTKEGSSHPDRNAQFEYINTRVTDFQQRGQPVISVDTKKKENVGDFKNGGREWHPKRKPEKVRTYDFVDKELGKAIPYGVYDPTTNTGWVSIGVDHDTGDFAIATIERWWEKMGKLVYPDATELLITADGGGSNSSRARLWKVRLQQLASYTGLRITVSHFPPGTSKWNKIEHRMFSHISMNWRGRPLTTHEVVVNLIANTTTRQGLKIQAELDQNKYPIGVKITDEEFEQLKIKRDEFHGDWNYTISPKE